MGKNIRFNVQVKENIFAFQGKNTKKILLYSKQKPERSIIKTKCFFLFDMLRFDLFGSIILLLTLCQTCKPVSIDDCAASKEKSEQSQSIMQQNIEKPQSSFVELPSDVIKVIVSKMRYYDLINIAQTSKSVYKTLEFDVQISRIVHQLRMLDLQDWDTKTCSKKLTKYHSKPVKYILKQSKLLNSLVKLLCEMPHVIETFHITIFDQYDWDLLQKDLFSIAQRSPRNSADKFSLTFHIDIKPTYEEFEILKKDFKIKFVFNVVQLSSTEVQKYKDLGSLVILDNSDNFYEIADSLARLQKVELPENLQNITVVNEIFGNFFDFPFYAFPFYALKLPKKLKRLDLINLRLRHEINEQFLPKSLIILTFNKVKFCNFAPESYRARILQLQNLEYLHLQNCNLYEGVRSQAMPNVNKLGIDFKYMINFNWTEDITIPELILSYQYRIYSNFERNVEENGESLEHFSIILKDLNNSKFQKKIIGMSISIYVEDPSSFSLPIRLKQSGLDLTNFSNLKMISVRVPEIQLYHLKLPTSIENIDIHFDNQKTNLATSLPLLSHLKDLKYLALKNIDLEGLSNEDKNSFSQLGSLATSLKVLNLRGSRTRSLGFTKGLKSLEYIYTSPMFYPVLEKWQKF